MLKSTHDSGGIVICKDKSSFDFEAAKAKLSASLKRDYSKIAREWPYQNVPRRIIAEEYISELGNDDYWTIRCFPSMENQSYCGMFSIVFRRLERV